MRCLFCHNPDTWRISGESKYLLSASELLDEVLKYKNFIAKGGVTLSGGEPLLQSEFIEEFFQLCRKEKIHTTLDTSGFFFNPQVEKVLDYTDLVLLDLKSFDAKLHTKLTGVSSENSFRFLDYLEEKGIKTWIRHVVVPGYTDKDEDLEKLARFLKPYTVIEKIELLPYHTMGVEKYQQLGIDYPLQGIDALSAERLANAQRIFQSFR